MSEKITDCETVQLIVDGDDAERVRFGDVENFSIDFDKDPESETQTAIEAAEKEYEFTVAFDPSFEFLLFWLGLLAQQGDT